MLFLLNKYINNNNNSNSCDHSPPTLQMDRLTTCHGITVLRYTLHGNKMKTEALNDNDY